MALSTAQLQVEILATFGIATLTIPAGSGWQGFPGVGQETGVDRSTIDPGAEPLQFQDGIIDPLEVRHLDAMQPRFKMDGGLALHHLLTLIIFLASQIDDILLVDP